MALAATKAEIAKAKRLWEANALPISALCRMVGRSPPWLYHHMRQGKWQGRETGPQVKRGQREHRHSKAAEAATMKQRYAAINRGRGAWASLWRQEGEKNERLRYGSLLDDVRLLRQRGFAVNCENAQYRVGNSLLDAAALQAKADRERRLAASPVA